MKIYNTDIEETFLKVIEENGQFILLNPEKFEKEINSYSLKDYEEAYLLMQGLRSGLLEMNLLNTNMPIFQQVQLLKKTRSLDENEALFTLSVFSHTIKKMNWRIEIMNLEQLETQMKELKDGSQIYMLGLAYYQGIGVSQDYEKAYELFMEAQLYNEDVYYYLGYMNTYGLGTPEDRDLAEYYFHKGISKNDKECYYGLGLLHQLMNKDYIDDFYQSEDIRSYRYIGEYELERGHIEEAFQAYLKGARLFESECLYQVGLLYLDSEHSFYDVEKALECLVYAYYLHHSKATRTLSQFYLKGQYLEKDIQKGLSLLKKSIELSKPEEERVYNNDLV